MKLQYFTYLSFFFLSVCDHWDDWDKIWHAMLGAVGGSIKIIMFRITDFPLAISFILVCC